MARGQKKRGIEERMNLSPDDEDVLELRHMQHDRTLFWATMPLPPSLPLSPLAILRFPSLRLQDRVCSSKIGDI